MDTLLRQKLKDAGFKFPKKNGCANCWGDLHQGCDNDCGQEYDPTLENLIEACGDRFSAICRQVADGSYSATGLGTRWFQGKTPEIAVSLLWLELQKSKIN